MSCTSRCRRAAPGHCCCECGGIEHGAEATVRQLPMALDVANVRALEDARAEVGPLRRSAERDGLLLLPGVRVNADGDETPGWIAAALETTRRLAWGLTQDEALGRARAARVT